MDTIEFSKEKVKEYIDSCINYWRNKKLEPAEDLDEARHKLICACYIDAYQCMRISLFGELLPKTNEQS